MVGLRKSLFNFDPSWERQRPFLDGLARSLPADFSQAQLKTLLAEPTGPLFYKDLLQFARGLQFQEKSELALELYAWLGARTEAPEGVRAAAVREVEALQGGGSFGGRAELLLKQVVKDSTDARVIAPMMGASIVGSLSKTWAMGRLLARPVGMLTRGKGAKLASQTFGFGLEGFAFAGFSRAISPPTGEGFGQDLARSYIGLGALKFSGSMGRALFPPPSVAGGAEGLLWGGARAMTPQLSMFFGMLAAHQLETRWGLRPETGSDQLIADTLAAMLSLQAGTKLGHAALGRGFQKFQREMELLHRAGTPGTLLGKAPSDFAAQGFLRRAIPEGIDFFGPWRIKGERLSERRETSDDGVKGRRRTDREVLELRGEFHFADPKNWTEAEIGEVVKAIVAQDWELYPGGEAGGMSCGSRYFKDRWYRVNGQELRLLNLVGRVRQARGLKFIDTKILPDSQILREWKEELFGLEVKEPEASRDVLEIKGEFRFADPKHWTEAEVGEVVKAIVAQDGDLYPGGDASPMSSGSRYVDRRSYRVNGEELRLGTLVRRVRQARGLKAHDNESLPCPEILREWKAGLFGLEVKEAVRSILELKGEFRFADPKRWTEAEIGEAVKAIVAQDGELYPGGDASPMSSGPRYFMDRWYRVNDKELRLLALASRVRQARGLKAHDNKTLPNSRIVREWKEGLFGLEVTETEASRGVLELKGEFRFADPKRWTEAEIGEVVKAIVAQDGELYPGGDAGLMSTGRRFFADRRYMVNGERLSLRTLAGRVSLDRGLKSNALPLFQVLREWKERLFGLDVKVPERNIQELKGEFRFADPKRWTEAEIGEVVKAIVAQDGELYPGGDPRPMSTDGRFFTDRWYRVKGEDVTLNTLAYRLRLSRGLRAGDTKALPDARILREWRKLLGALAFRDLNRNQMEGFIEEARLGPILELFSEDPAQLIEALAFLKGEIFKNKDVSEFVKAYVGLQVEGVGAKEKRIEANPSERRRKYLHAIFEALERGERLDLSEMNFFNQLRLLIRLSRKSFEESPGRLIQEFEQMSLRATHPFLQRLQSEAAAYFLAAKQFKFEGMQSLPYGYQREGARFLATRGRAVLADEAGMGKSYQVIAAAESLGLQRILWVTTAANKETLREEIFQHSQVRYEDVKVVISGDPRERQKQVRFLNGERYILTNYETLAAMRKSDPEGFAKLTRDLDLIVVDEAQLTDKVETLRTQAIHAISAPRRWLLTATPYQSHPERMWSLLHWIHPEQYPDFNAFKQLYCRSTQGLLLLHGELSKLMLRRTKKDTLYSFRPPGEIPFGRQLADGIPRLPQKERLGPEAGGSYELSAEQADLIAWMTADYQGWAEHHNRHLPNGAEPIDLTNLNALQKFDSIQKAIYSAERFGIMSENPLFPALDRRVAERLARGEKLILWAWNTEVVDTLEKRYQKIGLRRIDGGIVGQAREEARHDFQENPNVRILVANYQSGGVGLTLTAADAAIFVQLPQVYPALYQAEGRHQRLIGVNNLRHAKDKVFVEWMVPKFPRGFVEQIKDAKLREILSHGTLVEQTRRRLEGGETLYQLLMEGYGKFEDLDNYFKAGLIEGMGLNRSEPLDYVSHLKGEAREYAESAQRLFPLWKLAKGDPEAELRVLRLVELMKDEPQLAEQTGAAFAKAKRSDAADLAFIASLFEVKNKHIRQQLLKRVPGLLEQAYAQGKSLHGLIDGVKVGKLSPASFLAQIYLKAGAGGEAVAGISRALNQTRDTPMKRYLEEHFFAGALGILESPDAGRLMAEKGALFADSAPLPMKIHALYRLGLLARTRPELLMALEGRSFDGLVPFAKALESEVHRAVSEFADRAPEAVTAMLKANPEWRGNVDPLLALLAGYREGLLPNSETLLEQYRDALAHMLDGEYREWRRRGASGVEYLDDQPVFWDIFAVNRKVELGKIEVSPKKVRATLVKDYLSLRAEYLQTSVTVEGPWVFAKLEEYRKADAEDRRDILTRYQGEIGRLGRILGEGPLGEPGLELLKKYRLAETSGFAQKTAVQEKLTELRNLVAWMRMDQSFQSLGKGEGIDRNTVIRDLDAKARFYRSRKYDKMAEHFETLQEAVERYGAETITFKGVTVEDTDDPAVLARMGAIHPELLNCFNPNGNPVFHQFVVSALGSKNMKMVVVREEGKAVALAMVKVKRTEDGAPVLFLERGLYRKSYDFRQEMLAHLQDVAKRMSPMPIVMTQIEGKIRPEDPQVYGTGSYTGSEYVEPVFGIRSSEHVKHRGRVVEMKEINPRQQPFGIGTSNLSMEAYIHELKSQGIRTVVDVRAQPFSRFRPHFNRESMKMALQAAGIDYVWMGDTLGNPKDAKGERTLEGFQSYMQTPSYAEGLARLQALIEKTTGRVALTCAEAKECDCHRKYILEDLAKP